MWFALMPAAGKAVDDIIATCTVLVKVGAADLEKSHVRNPPAPLAMVVQVSAHSGDHKPATASR